MSEAAPAWFNGSRIVNPLASWLDGTERKVATLQELDKTPQDLKEEQERANCSACQSKTMHNEETWKNHPSAGMGTNKK